MLEQIVLLFCVCATAFQVALAEDMSRVPPALLPFSIIWALATYLKRHGITVTLLNNKVAISTTSPMNIFALIVSTSFTIVVYTDRLIVNRDVLSRYAYLYVPPLQIIVWALLLLVAWRVERSTIELPRTVAAHLKKYHRYLTGSYKHPLGVFVLGHSATIVLLKHLNKYDTGKPSWAGILNAWFAVVTILLPAYLAGVRWWRRDIPFPRNELYFLLSILGCVVYWCVTVVVFVGFG